ncbi:hypothetical protein, partial [Candidatus Flexifilum breve]|uniref:hypothetical protein n=1 Tax=Candidatus Flexifilum breve TaxID=3140694 RepID=UPI0031CC7E81
RTTPSTDLPPIRVRASGRGQTLGRLPGRHADVFVARGAALAVISGVIRRPREQANVIDRCRPP